MSIAVKAAFLDRDGVLNRDVGYVGTLDRFEWLPGSREAVSKLKAAGYLVLVVTNQSGVARGFYTEDDVRRVHDAIQRDLAATGTAIDDFHYCPHHPDGHEAAYAIVCNCRKPEPGMLLALIDRYGIDRASSFMIGDRSSDLEAAHSAGIRGILFDVGRLDDLVDQLLDSITETTP